MDAPVQQHQRSLYIIALLVIVGIGSIFFFKRYQYRQNITAHNEMFQAVYSFEEGQFEQALFGNGEWMGMLDIIQNYRWTTAANLAHFYVGVAYMHQQDYEDAIRHLRQFKAKDFLLQARAWSLLGDAYSEQHAYAKAVQYYLKAANYKPNKEFTPAYLSKAALAYEANNNSQGALTCYQRIVKEFPTASQYGEACKHVARLTAVHLD